MSHLQQLLVEAKKGLEPWEKIPDSELQWVANQCKAPELAEIQERIGALKAELTTVEEWDGDTQDDINLAIAFFAKLAQLASHG